MIDEIDHTDALVVRVGRPEAVAVFSGTLQYR
jgi:hypothetical protein